MASSALSSPKEREGQRGAAALQQRIGEAVHRQVSTLHRREMAMRMTVAAAAMALVAVMCVLAPRAVTQAPNTPSCAANLVPCAPYMNTTGPPPDACCGPLKDAVQNDLKCLCDLYATPPPHPPRREDELVDGGWPAWLLDNVPREALRGIVLKSADAYDMIEKVGEGSYSTVYKARERGTGRTVALKMVRCNTSDSESVRFMATEIEFLQRLDHPNVMKLEGIAMAASPTNGTIYLVFELMYSDLGWLVFRSGQRLTEPQIKWYMQQLLAGLQHCHERGILHLDIKGCNLLIDRHGVLKIGDFGLASYYGAGRRLPPPNRVVSLWYRAPELLLGATSYGVGVDLWSAGCILAEMFLGKTLMPGSGAKDQLLQIFRLFGSPPDDYWRKMELSPSLKPPETYNSTTAERFHDLPPSALGLLATLLALDPAERGTAGQALQSSFFCTPPLPLAEPWPLVDERKPRLRDITISRSSLVLRHRLGLGANNPRHIPPQVVQDQDDDELTDTANSGHEPVTDTGNPGQVSAAANASSSAHDASSEETIVNASPSTVAKRWFSVSPVVQEARPVQMVVAQDQKQLPTANTSHHRLGRDDDHHENLHLVPSPDHDDGEEEEAEGEPPSGSGSGSTWLFFSS